jgi:four helix bundle protein
MEARIQHFKDLRIWQMGMEVVKDVYRLTQKFPKEEMYCLSQQMRRAAVSIPSNIAEGFKRFHLNENKQFLAIALSSAAELETQILIAHELRYINHDELSSVCDKLDHLSKMMMLFLKRMKK